MNRKAVSIVVVILSLAVLSAAPEIEMDNEELNALCAADQADRLPPPGKGIDWSLVGPRDRVREARVLEMYSNDALRTGKDYFHAALVLQHSQTADVHLLAHELSIVAIVKGERQARWLAAAAEDRFLMNIGRPQRFATQFRSEPPSGGMRLYKVDPAVTDTLRHQLDVPPLDEAKKREAAMR